jgi:predicted nucleotidyltransferase
MDREAILTGLRTFFATARKDIVAAWLFGSVARGTATADSDIDIAVLIVKSTADAATALDIKLSLEAELDHRLRSEIDVVVVNTAPADLVHRILRDGVLLLERDPSARIEFEVRSRGEYFDMVPILQRYRRFQGVEP